MKNDRDISWVQCNALPTVRQQTMICTSAALIVNWTLVKFESNAVYKITAILFRPQCVNMVSQQS